MSTKCFIAKKERTGVYVAIHCNRNGQTDYVGDLLKAHYQNSEKVNALLALGDISSLGTDPYYTNLENINPDYECYPKYVNSLRRRGQDNEFINPKRFTSFKELLEGAYRYEADYIYVFDGNEWKCYFYDGKEVTID